MSPHVFSLALLFLSCNRALCSRRRHRRFPVFQFVAALVEIGNKAVSQHAENGTLGGTTRHGKPTKQAPSMRDASRGQGSKTCAPGGLDSAGSGIQDRCRMHRTAEPHCKVPCSVCRGCAPGTSRERQSTACSPARLCSPPYRVHPLLGGQDAMPPAAPCPCLPACQQQPSLDIDNGLSTVSAAWMIFCAAHQHAGSPANCRAGSAPARA